MVAFEASQQTRESPREIYLRLLAEAPDCPPEKRPRFYDYRFTDIRNNILINFAERVWMNNGLLYYISESPVYHEIQKALFRSPDLPISSFGLISRWNGYVQFPAIPLRPGEDGIQKYIPVHGGITYWAWYESGQAVYGFDTGHASSLEDPDLVNDLDWVALECESLGRAIQIAARFEPYYDRAAGNRDRRIQVLQHMQKFLPISPTSNMQIMLAILSGDI